MTQVIKSREEGVRGDSNRENSTFRDYVTATFWRIAVYLEPTNSFQNIYRPIKKEYVNILG